MAALLGVACPRPLALSVALATTVWDAADGFMGGNVARNICPVSLDAGAPDITASTHVGCAGAGGDTQTETAVAAIGAKPHSTAR